MLRVLLIIVVLILAAVGFIGILYPAALQSYVLRTQSDTWAWRLNPFRDRMKRPSYRTYLRFMSIFVLVFALLCAFAIIVSR
jgi:hypothetical protein